MSWSQQSSYGASSGRGNPSKSSNGFPSSGGRYEGSSSGKYSDQGYSSSRGGSAGYPPSSGTRGPAPSSQSGSYGASRAPAPSSQSGSYGGSGYSSSQAGQSSQMSSRGGVSSSSGGLGSILVSGCANQTVGAIIKGNYRPAGENHGKPVYKKTDPGSSAVTVLIYFWDERDGPNFSGWWFGPKVGGDQVWAHNCNSQSSTPPTIGWKVPWDGPVDASLKITSSSAASGASVSSRSGRPSDSSMGDRDYGHSQKRGMDRREDEDRRRHDMERQRREDEDRRRAREAESRRAAQAEVQRVQAEQQRKEQERKRRQEEEERARRQKEEQQRRQREEEARREEARRQEEIRRKQEEARREEDRRRKEEEEMRRRKRKAEEEQKRKETAAALAVRKVIQRLRVATPENLGDLRKELEETQAAQLEEMGSQAKHVQQESKQALEQAEKKVEETLEKRKADEKRRLEEEAKRKEEEELSEKCTTEATEEVAKLEADVAKTQVVAEGMSKNSADPDRNIMTPDDMIAAAKETEEACGKTMTLHADVSKAVDAKKHEMGNTDAAYSRKHSFNQLQNRLQDAKSSIDKLLDSAKGTKERAHRRSQALKKEKDQKDSFAKYDTRGTGKLSKENIKAFAKAEYEVECTDEFLTKAFSQTSAADGSGVGFEKFARLKQVLAIHKSEVKAREKRAQEEERKRIEAEQEEERKRVLEERKTKVKLLFEQCEEFLSEAEAALEKVDAAAEPLWDLNKLSVKEIHATVKATQAASEPATAALEKSNAKIQDVDVEMGEDLKVYGRTFTVRINIRLKKCRDRMEKSENWTKDSLEKAKIKECESLEVKREQVVKAIRDKLNESGKKSEELFAAIDGASDDALPKASFLEFLRSLQVSFEEDEADKFFDHVAQEGNDGKFTKQQFVEMVKVFYKCVKATTLSEEHSIKSKTVARLSIADVMEVLEGPKKEETASVDRVRVMRVQDDVVGWVTIAGNQGTVFLEPGGNAYVCVKETLITDSISIQDSKTVRRLAKGEAMDVLEFGKKDGQCDVFRVKGKAKKDGVVGWVTVAGNQGTTYLEPS